MVNLVERDWIDVEFVEEMDLHAKKKNIFGMIISHITEKFRSRLFQ